jgi:hypothetical protein
LIPWLGHHVLRITTEISAEETGSGDKLYDWLLVALFATVAVVATIVWSILDRRRARYDRLASLFHVFLRYHLGIQMLDYGLAKVIPAQFPVPGPSHILEPFGEASPMRMLWAFMGASPAYVVFAGLGEVTGGLLVWFRRTATLGALVSAGVLLNVVMLNYCYDVPVKLFASHLLLMALLVAAPDLRRLADLLVLHRPTTPRAFAWSPSTRGLRVARAVVKFALLAFVVGFGLHESHKYYGEAHTHPAHYGVFDVAAQTGTSYRAAFLSSRSGGLRDDQGVALRFQLPPKDGAVETSRRGNKEKGTLKLTMPDADHILLDGTVGSEKIALKLERRQTPPLFSSRGFHFVNEFPFNR